jgi:hypothetical protein
MAQPDQATKTEVLRIVGSDFSGPSTLRFVGERISQIESLILVSALFYSIDEAWRDDRDNAPDATGRVSYAVWLAQKFEVSRISYNSPLEIFFYISSTATAVSATAHQLLRLFNKFSDTRKKHADTNLHVEYTHYLRSELRSLYQHSKSNSDYYLITGQIAEASRALQNTDDISIEEPE